MLKKLQREMTKIFLPKRKGVPTSMKYLSYVVVGIVAYAIYDVLIKGVLQEGMKGDHGDDHGGGHGGKKKEFIFIRMEGCGHCDNMKGEWREFEENHNMDSIKVTEVEQSEPRGRHLVKKHKVRGFPTILLLDHNGNKIKDYEGGRTASEFKQFCQENN